MGAAASTPQQSPADGIDIFCRVVDNYGDIGVCWRLARQLAARAQTRLWVDDLRSFARIEPTISPHTTGVQRVRGVDVYPWAYAEDPAIVPLRIVIEAFACDLPAAFLARLQPTEHRWFNLEYLSAEAWVQDCHGLPSYQSNSVPKYFFFPGFTPRTGGLLREPGLLQARDTWCNDPHRHGQLLQGLGLPATWISGIVESGWRQVYAFCYPHAPLQALVDACARLDRPTVLLAAPGAPQTQLDNDKVRRFDCPFVDQDRFDRLLWCSDLNLVRGEDSFVRAIWAARPFLWHIYPQQEDVHMDKLQAWLDLNPCPPDAAQLMLAWNRGDSAVVTAALTRLLQRDPWQAWQRQAQQFCAAQAREPCLVERLWRQIQSIEHNSPRSTET